jgi:hypothetical protein
VLFLELGDGFEWDEVERRVEIFFGGSMEIARFYMLKLRFFEVGEEFLRNILTI